jgi:hypothetical protein
MKIRTLPILYRPATLDNQSCMQGDDECFARHQHPNRQGKPTQFGITALGNLPITYFVSFSSFCGCFKLDSAWGNIIACVQRTSLSGLWREDCSRRGRCNYQYCSRKNWQVAVRSLTFQWFALFSGKSGASMQPQEQSFVGTCRRYCMNGSTSLFIDQLA